MTNLSQRMLGTQQMVQMNFENNKLSFIDEFVFKDMSRLEAVYFGDNPISLKEPDYVKHLCNVNQNPLCKIYI
jgi:hypothetical protein